MERPTKINLGSNDVRYDGFLNVDIRKIPAVDIVDDVMKLNTIEDGSLEHIIAHNILEHISPDRVMDVLKLWRSKLQVKGMISIGVPDGDFIFRRWIDGIMPWEDVVHDIFGNIGMLREWHGDDAEKYGHHIIFCKSYLDKLCSEAGLTKVKEEKPNHGAGFTTLYYREFK